MLETVIEVDRPPAEVFTLATDPTRFPLWQRDVASVRLLGDGRFETTRRFAGARRTLTQRIARDEPPHHWAAQGLDGPIRAHATITVEPIDQGTRSRVTFTLDLEGHGVGVALVPLVRRQAERGAPRSYDNLRRLLEDSPAVPR